MCGQEQTTKLVEKVDIQSGKLLLWGQESYIHTQEYILVIPQTYALDKAAVKQNLEKYEQLEAIFTGDLSSEFLVIFVLTYPAIVTMQS